MPLLGFIQSSFTNQDQQTVSGLDFGVNASFEVTPNITFRTVADGSKDFPAIRLIMGHTDGSIDAVYREQIEEIQEVDFGADGSFWNVTPAGLNEAKATLVAAYPNLDPVQDDL